jgi:hypothetical protein
VADLTRAYIEEHPSIREALADELLNYTALARKIQAERGIRNEEAVTIACRRFERGLRADTPELHAVRTILQRSRLQVHSRVAIVRFHDDWEILDRLLQFGRATLPDRSHRRMFQLFQGTVALTLLCEEDYLGTVLPEIPARSRLSVERGLATLAFRSEPEVADIPGVLAQMADALFRRGINCLETVSVHTDSIFVFRDEDVIPAYQVLSDLCPPAAPDDRPPAKSRGVQSADPPTPRGTRPS